MAQALELEGDERVLEVGCGSGYSAAVLSLLCRELVTIERHVALADQAKALLRELGRDNVEVRAGDGTLGAPDRAPFDGISVTATAEGAAPHALLDQLAPKGDARLPGPARRTASTWSASATAPRRSSPPSASSRWSATSEREAPAPARVLRRRLVVRRMRGRPYIAAVRVKDGTRAGAPEGPHRARRERRRDRRARGARGDGRRRRRSSRSSTTSATGTRATARACSRSCRSSSSATAPGRCATTSARWTARSGCRSRKQRRVLVSRKWPVQPCRSWPTKARLRRVFVLNFYSPVFVDQLRRHRKTATIRLGDKSAKYRKGNVVMVTVGFQHSPREKIFLAVIDEVEAGQGALPARHRARQPGVPPPRRDDPLPRADLRPLGERGRHRHGGPLLRDQGAPAQRVLRAPARLGAAPELGVSTLDPECYNWHS